MPNKRFVFKIFLFVFIPVYALALFYKQIWNPYIFSLLFYFTIVCYFLIVSHMQTQ